MSTPTILVGGAPVAIYEVSVTDGVVNQHHLGCIEEHPRGRNWIAVVVPNRARPGGLDREFLPRARGLFYRTPGVKAGDFIEVGGDYITSTDKRRPNRRYFRVLLVREQTWVLRDAECPEDTLTIPPLAQEVVATLEALAPPVVTTDTGPDLYTGP